MRPLTVLDLGSGTGHFTPDLTGEFEGPVYGVEPRPYSRSLAETKFPHPGVSYLAGSAENIPLPDQSCHVVVMRNVWWQIVADELAPGAVVEISRVLHPTGRVVIHDYFSDRPFTPEMRLRFPRDTEGERDRYPTVDQTLAFFSSVGLRNCAELTDVTGYLLCFES